MAVAGGGYGGGQLRQRGAERDQGQADHRFGDAGRARDRDRALDQELRAQHQAADAGGDDDQRQPRPGRRPAEPGQVRFLRRWVAVGGGLAPAAEPEIAAEQRQHDRAVDPAERTGHGKTREQRGRDQHRAGIATHHARAGRNRMDHRGRAQDQQNVGDVRADHVADADVGQAVQAGGHRDHQLRHRGRCGDHGQADQQRRKPEDARQPDRPAQQQLAAAEQEQEAAEGLGEGDEGHGRVGSEAVRGTGS